MKVGVLIPMNSPRFDSLKRAIEVKIKMINCDVNNPIFIDPVYVDDGKYQNEAS